jgi:hypothetical protein
MKGHASKFLFVISLLFVSSFSVVQAQGFAGGVSIKGFQPSLSRVVGKLEEGWAFMSESMAIEAFGEHQYESGFTFHGELGWQYERTYLFTCIPDGVCGGNGKDIQSLILTGGGGYRTRIAGTRFYGFANAGIGLGRKYLHNMDQEMERTTINPWYDSWTGASGVDTAHIYISTIDHDLPKVDMQFRFSLGAEYRSKNLFVRAFVEARHWASRAVQIQYVVDRHFVQHDDPITPYISQHSTGNYFIRAGYVGIGVGAGWYFGKTE